MMFLDARDSPQPLHFQIPENPQAKNSSLSYKIQLQNLGLRRGWRGGLGGDGVIFFYREQGLHYVF